MQPSSILVPARSRKAVPSGASIASGEKRLVLVISQDTCAMSITYVDKRVRSLHRTGLRFISELGCEPSGPAVDAFVGTCCRRYKKKCQGSRQSCRNCSSRPNSAHRTQCPHKHYLCFSFSVYLLLRQSLSTPSSRLPNQG